jgi:cysteine desulfurase
MDRLYLDWNATSPLRPEAAARLIEVLSITGNPSSVHAEGRAARAILDTARRDVAFLVNAKDGNVFFTGGGTEAIAMALTREWSVGGKRRVFARLLVGATEHVAMLAGGDFVVEARQIVPVGPDGCLDLAALQRGLTASSEPSLVAVQAANNETGVLQPVMEIASLVHAHDGVLVCDAVQAAGKIPLDIDELGADALILSAHKIGGPQGAGALVLRSQATGPAKALIRGGGQEMGRRAGTEAVAAIAAFGVAASLSLQEMQHVPAQMAALRDKVENGVLSRLPEATIFGRAAPRLPNTSLIGLDGAPAATLLMALDLSGIAVSSGSACSSGKVKRSHVLDAMNVPRSLAESAIRVSIGRGTTESDVIRFLEGFETAAKCLYRGARAA